MHRRRCRGLSPIIQILVAHQQVKAVGQVIDGGIHHAHLITVAGVLNLVAQHRGAHCGRAHAGVAGKHDLGNQGRAGACGQGGAHRRLLALHALHLGSGLRQIILGLLREPQNSGCDHARHRGGPQYPQDHAHIGIVRGRPQNGDNRTRCGGGAQAGTGDGLDQNAGHAAANSGQDQRRLHQHIREIDFVNTAKEVNDGGTWCGGARGTTAEERVGEQNPQARARIGLQEEQNGLAGFHRLFGG